MIRIEIPDMNDSISRVVLEGVEYLIRFTYCSVGDYWTFGLYTNENIPIVTAIRMVPNFPLNHYFKSADMPDGIFGVVSKKENVGRDAFTSGGARFVFIPRREIPKEALDYER